jgi:hypothetical protein
MGMAATPAAPTCARCGASLEPGDRYCGRCGEPVRGPRVLTVTASQTSGKALAALLFGVAGLFVAPVVCSIVAVVLGHSAQAEFEQHSALEGRWMATTGMALGYVGIVLGAVVLFVAIGLVASVR